MDEPLISIIVPIYNVELWLQRCIDSIINQTYHNLQILLINDGSTDHSESICLSYKDPRIEYIYTEHRGTSAARNEGLFRANGMFIGFADADDWCEQNMYETLLNAIQRDQSDAARCNHYIIKGKTKKQSIKQPLMQTVTGREAIVDILYRTNVSGFGGTVWNTLFRADVIRRNNLIMFDPTLSFGEDADWIFRFLLRCSYVSFVPDCLYNYNKENTSSVTYCFRNDYPIRSLQNRKEYLIKYGFSAQHIDRVDGSLYTAMILGEIDRYCHGYSQEIKTINECSILHDVLKKNGWSLGMLKISIVMLLIRMHLPATLIELIMRFHR